MGSACLLETSAEIIDSVADASKYVVWFLSILDKAGDW